MGMMLQYRGYLANIGFRWYDALFHGYTTGMNTCLSFSGKSVDAATQDFHRVVNEYLADCKERGVTPEKPFEQNKRVYIDKALFRRIRQHAEASGQSVNEAAELALLGCFPAEDAASKDGQNL